MHSQRCAATLCSLHPQICRCASTFSSPNKALVQLQQKLILRVCVANVINNVITVSLRKQLASTETLYDKPTESVSVKAAAKIQPFLDDGKGKKIIRTSSDKVIVEDNGKEQTFKLDYAFGPHAKSTDIYQDSCDGLIKRALLGYNITVLVAGVSGSGKTYLLSGTEEEPGLAPCIISGLYNNINEVRGKKEVFVTSSFLEVVDEKLTDMLNPHPNQMNIREHPELGIYIDGLSELVAYSEADLLRLYIQGNRARKMGVKDGHAHRSGSTGIFYINIEEKQAGSNKVGLRSTITIVDLAGIDAYSGAKNVVSIISALKSGGSLDYRNSKVTRLLQESLGGNAITLMLLTLLPAEKYCQESLQSLQFAQTACSVKNKIKVNVDETQGLISDLREGIARLRNKIAQSSESNKEDVLKLEELIKDLQVAKKLTWQEKEKMARIYEEERKTNLANKGILDWVMDSARRDNKEIHEKIMLLQREKDQLTQEYKDKRKEVDDMKEELQNKIADYSKLAESGKANEKETKKRVTAIHELKEKLKRDTEVLKSLKKKLKDIQDKLKEENDAAQGITVTKGNPELRYKIEAEERRRIEVENKTLIAEELERMKMEAEHQKAEIQAQEAAKLECDLVDHKAEKSVVALKIQTLQQEKEHLQSDLDRTHKRHKDELEIQQLQHFQTFRQYREQFEQQKAILDQRYRKLLEDAVQDAVFLSSRNNLLMEESENLQKEIGELKDRLSVSEGKAPAKAK
ncbi:hypothetical protein LSH36_12g02042 [Paralvinella palmiformis]|uniref:Kinesin motor domain-containing protein n=1 Tax=Paralvinella palmiformis TaxID=53620 RepID=A0AAD9KEJ7_9ANNE|nr:hypothetical protein LSH36_12g02042 [Paralvinella palmiformis]